MMLAWKLRETPGLDWQFVTSNEANDPRLPGPTCLTCLTCPHAESWDIETRDTCASGEWSWCPGRGVITRSGLATAHGSSIYHRPIASDLYWHSVHIQQQYLSHSQRWPKISSLGESKLMRIKRLIFQRLNIFKDRVHGPGVFRLEIGGASFWKLIDFWCWILTR